MKAIKKLSVSTEKGKRHLYKALSLFFSISLWFYVLNSEPLEVEKIVDVTLLNPPDLAVVNLPPSEVTVKLRGSRAFMNNLFKSGEKIVIDLKNYPVKNSDGFNVNLSASDVPVPFGVDVLEIHPHQFKVQLDREIRKKVPLRAQLIGDLPAELKLMESSISPEEVMIRGPVEIMRKVTSLRTTEIVRSELQGEGEVRVGIADLDPRISIEDSGPYAWNYKVRPNRANFTLKNIDIRFLTTSTRFRAATKAVSLDVLAPDGIDLKKSDVQVVAEIPDGASGKLNVKLRAILPDGVYLRQINPETISVMVGR